MENSLDKLPLIEQLAIYERNARHTTGGLREHCLKKAEQVRSELHQQIEYYEVITDDTFRS